jgi:hypothetical protein
MTYDINKIDRQEMVEAIIKLLKNLGFKDELSFEEIPPEIQVMAFIEDYRITDRQEAYNAGRKSVIEEIDRDKRLMNCYEGCSCRERLLNKLKQ